MFEIKDRAIINWYVLNTEYYTEEGRYVGRRGDLNSIDVVTLPVLHSSRKSDSKYP
jgi:hypothetical protein